jgi:GT2 family glycosyltransferase
VIKKIPRLSVLINICNRANILPYVLEGIFNQDYPKEKMEIFVLNDASKDNTLNILNNCVGKFKKENFKDIKIYSNEKTKHIAWGRHFLSSKISTECEAILFMDDDVFLEKNCFKELVSGLFWEKDIGIIGPRIVYCKYPDKTAHCASFVNFWTGRYTDIDSEKEIECDWLNSSCMLVKKSALLKSGGFYPGFYVSHQEVDFCLKVKKAGFKILYYPAIKVKHDIELKKRKSERLYYIYRNKMLVIHRNFSFFNRIVALSLIIIFGLPKYILESVKFNQGFDFAEIKLILKSVFHGLLKIENKLMV